MTESDEFPYDPAADEYLAGALGMAARDFVEMFGSGWSTDAPILPAVDAEPSGGRNGWFEPWFVSGRPAQLMLRVDDPVAELAIPRGRWVYGTHGLGYEPIERRRVVPRERPDEAESVIREFLKRRRSGFRYCRYCRQITPPELRIASDCCMTCATIHQGVVY